MKIRSICFVIGLTALFTAGVALAQTDIHVSGPAAGFPVALPQICDGGGGAPYNSKIPEIISKNLQVSGLFKVLDPSSFLEAPGKCEAPDKVGFPDWSVIGAEGLVKGSIKTSANGQILVELYLYDVQQQKAVIGKRYESEGGDYARIAHRFSNEIMRFFTGEKGVFGTRIAYIGKVGRFKELFIMDLDGSNSRQLTRDRGIVLSPSWSPAGDKIMYTSFRTRKPEIYMISPEGGSPKQITSREGMELGSKFTPDARSIISSASSNGNTNIVMFDLRGKIIQNLTNSSGIEVSPSLSPDGGQIAFCSNRSGGPQIYVMDSAGGNAHRISFTNSNYCTSPAWSPKGDKIAFVCRAGGNQLFLSAPDGSQSVQLTFSGNNEDPSWAPDGRSLAFSSDAGRGSARNISILPLLGGGSPKRISVSNVEEGMPSWSPRID